MSQSNGPSQLQKAATEVTEGKTEAEKIASLSRAFEMFSEETTRLENAYFALMQSFEQVNLKLEDTNAQLEHKVHELNVVTHYLNSILNHMAQGLIYIDFRGTLTTYNGASEIIFEMTQGQVLFRAFWEIFEDTAFGFSMREALASRHVPPQTRVHYQTPKGGQRELEISISMAKDSGREQMQGLIVLIRDMTEMRQLQLIANRNDRMKELGELAAQVAHEIRNPLGGIRGFASLLQRDLEGQPDQKRMAHQIVEGADRLNELVNQVLNYARPLQMHIETLDIVGVARDVLTSVQADKNFNQKVKCELDTTAKAISIQADPKQMQSLFFNLVLNALQAMPEGGKLKVFIGTSHQDMVIRVQDNGIGISQENLEKIFSPFFTTKAEGNGFGLTEVYKIVQAVGGSIDVDSTVGVGTTFRIHIPSHVEVIQ